MYLSVSERGECGGWSLEDDHLPESTTTFPDASKLRERSVLWAVSIPGQASWCATAAQGAGAGRLACSCLQPCNFLYGSVHSNQTTAHKFPIPGAAHVAAQVKVSTTNKCTRPLSSAEPTVLFTRSTMTPPNRSNQRTSLALSAFSHQSSAPPSLLRACVSFFFLKLTIVPRLHSEFTEPTLVHTLHVLFHRSLPKLIVSCPPLHSSVDTLEVRTALIDWLATEALGGDRDAAEWVLLGSIASAYVHSRPSGSCKGLTP